MGWLQVICSSPFTTRREIEQAAGSRKRRWDMASLVKPKGLDAGWDWEVEMSCVPESSACVEVSARMKARSPSVRSLPRTRAISSSWML